MLAGGLPLCKNIEQTCISAPVQGGKDFVETYANHVNDFEAVVEE